MRKAGEEQKRRPKLKDKEETPISSQLVAINPGGIAALVDGTYWRIAPGDLARAKKWIPGTVITVTPRDAPGLPFKPTNVGTGEPVAPPLQAAPASADPRVDVVADAAFDDALDRIAPRPVAQRIAPR